MTFAPNEALKASETYAITIAASLKDASGVALGAQQVLHFTTAGTAPAAPPLIDDLPTTGCFTTITMTGRATPGARVRLDADGIALNTTASDSGAFKFTFSFSGRSGFDIVRVRELGSDGSYSAERAICFRNNCELPRVVGATLDRTAKKFTIDFSRAMDATTLVLGNTIVFDLPLAGTLASSGQTATLAFDAALPESTIALTVKKSVKDVAGASMAADYAQSFAFETSVNERSKGYVTGAVYDATAGRPFANATIAIGATALTTDARGRYSRALNDAFMAGYCMHLVRGDRDHPTEVGLGFATPKRARNRVDIDGVLGGHDAASVAPSRVSLRRARILARARETRRVAHLPRDGERRRDHRPMVSAPSDHSRRLALRQSHEAVHQPQGWAHRNRAAKWHTSSGRRDSLGTHPSARSRSPHSHAHTRPPPARS